MKKSLLLLTEAGDSIGLGHYTRCSAIQEYAQSAGIMCKMVVYVKGEYQLHFDGERVDWLHELDWLETQARQSEKVLVDSYLATSELYQILKKNFLKVIVLDDYNRVDYNAGLLINPNVFFDENTYQNQKGNKVGGKEYVILRAPFRRVYEHQIKERENILVTIGGSDYRNLIPTIIKALQSISYKQLKVITPEDRKYANEGIDFLGKQTAEQMLSNFQWADVVISACGQTLHELASMGKPTVGICIDIDQQPNQAYYLSEGFLHQKIDWDDTEIETKIQKAVNQLNSTTIRRDIAQKAPLLINKNGVENIVEAINTI